MEETWRRRDIISVDLQALKKMDIADEMERKEAAPAHIIFARVCLAFMLLGMLIPSSSSVLFKIR